MPKGYRSLHGAIMNFKLQEKDASALFLALDEIVNFD